MGIYQMWIDKSLIFEQITGVFTKICKMIEVSSISAAVVNRHIHIIFNQIKAFVVIIPFSAILVVDLLMQSIFLLKCSRKLL